MLASLILLPALALALPTPQEVAAGVARASTPLRPDRPASLAAAAAALAPWGASLPAMWAQAAAHDGTSSTDCRAWMLQYELSIRQMPERAPLRDVFDALRLGTDCGVTPPAAPASTAYFKPLTPAEVAQSCTSGTFYVNATGGSDSAVGTMEAPFKTLPRALAATRAAGARPAGQTACIILRGGVHYLPATQVLGAGDSGLTVTALAGDAAPAWVSGGVPLGELAWSPFNVAAGMNIYVADIAQGTPITAMAGLNTLDGGSAMPTRLWRAMFPNFDMEQFSGDLPGDAEVVKWVKPPIMDIPVLVYKDLKASGQKDDSTMREYNIYAAGKGGPCEHWGRVNDEMWSYVCSNSTAGGWEEIERGFASTGQLGFPIAMHWNKTKLPARLSTWTLPSAENSFDWSNTPVLTQWHNQGWCVFFFASQLARCTFSNANFLQHRTHNPHTRTVSRYREFLYSLRANCTKHPQPFFSQHQTRTLNRGLLCRGGLGRCKRDPQHVCRWRLARKFKRAGYHYLSPKAAVNPKPNPFSLIEPYSLPKT